MNTRPPAYQAPDRAAWEKKHGHAPRPISGIPTRFSRRARLQVQKDWSRLSAAAAHQHQAALEAICEEAAALAAVPAGADVFFDPDDGQFWLYPHSETATR